MPEWSDLSREGKLILIVMRRLGPGMSMPVEDIIAQAQALDHLTDAEIKALRAQMMMGERN